ncbi:MAG: MarR family transcriptional regulator [Chromatiales bacterium]|nr:MarR family transcriptional regulator [Chromatiales bacterium]
MVYRLDNTLGFAIHRAAVYLHRAFGQRLRPYELTPEQFALLSRLWEEDGVPQRVLAERLLKDRPTVTRILDRMVDKGLVTRRMDPADRRSYSICLTDKGRELQAPLVRLAMEVRECAFAELDEDERERVRQILNRISANLDGPTGGGQR